MMGDSSDLQFVPFRVAVTPVSHDKFQRKTVGRVAVITAVRRVAAVSYFLVIADTVVVRVTVRGSGVKP
jgi:hypothetical protein